jgi:endonuclease-3 related protein
MGVYHRLNDFFGDLHWWPAQSPLEVIVGAILTQNTAWQNVEQAMDNLSSSKLLSIRALQYVGEEVLAQHLRPSGYYRLKAKRLKAFVRFLRVEYEDSLDKMFAEPLLVLRSKLLSVSGIGEETADSILLYAGGKPVFVVDAYTRRILSRHGFIGDKTSYTDIQALFMNNLPVDAMLYNQYHALLVNTGKHFCRKVSRCDPCPLAALPEHHKP